MHENCDGWTLNLPIPLSSASPIIVMNKNERTAVAHSLWLPKLHSQSWTASWYATMMHHKVLHSILWPASVQWRRQLSVAVSPLALCKAEHYLACLWENSKLTDATRLGYCNKWAPLGYAEIWKLLEIMNKSHAPTLENRQETMCCTVSFCKTRWYIVQVTGIWQWPPPVQQLRIALSHKKYFPKLFLYRTWWPRRGCRSDARAVNQYSRN